jgi:hypothetical protein
MLSYVLRQILLDALARGQAPHRCLRISRYPVAVSRSSSSIKKIACSERMALRKRTTRRRHREAFWASTTLPIHSEMLLLLAR